METGENLFNKKYETPTHTLSVEYKGVNEPSFNMDEENAKEVLQFKISVQNKETKKKISFNFWESQHNTEIFNEVLVYSPFNRVYLNGERMSHLTIQKWKKEINKEILYSVLNCIALDYHADFKNEYDFFNEFGYTPSMKAKCLYYRVVEQAEKLQSVFNESDINKFDENDDTLKKTIEREFIKKE